VLPAFMATCCLPAKEKVMGGLSIHPPNDVFHRTTPLRASRAKKYESRLAPAKAKSDSVESTPVNTTLLDVKLHLCSPVCGSMAWMALGALLGT
jgi:hypothetical protein